MAKKIISGINSPAFPSGVGVGISKRYWTAVMIAQGLMSNQNWITNHEDETALFAFKIANALLEMEDI